MATEGFMVAGLSLLAWWTDPPRHFIIPQDEMLCASGEADEIDDKTVFISKRT